MQLVRSLRHYRGGDRPLALAIGNFDGLHLGHRKVLDEILKESREQDLIPAVMTFEPHPRDFFSAGKAALPRLFTFRDKLKAFEAAGIEKVFCVRFNAEFAAQTPEQYVRDLLKDRLNVASVAVGSLFFFGRGGKASYEDLRRLGSGCGIRTQAVDGVSVDGVRVSSTAIRVFLKEGRLEEAACFLGRPYAISGRVGHGNALGRTLGFPTANLSLKGMNTPLSGVFAVRVRTPYGDFDGMCNVGERPTIAESRKRCALEVNLFGFDGDLYAREIAVEFKKKIRDEIRFEDLKALKEALARDRVEALKALRV